jgi:hypothetical protein
MELLFNVYLTSSPANVYVNLDRGTLSKSSKLDITKYSLSSLASMYSWKKAIINVELDLKVYKEQDYIDLENFINTEFLNIEVIYSRKRATLQKEWIDICQKLNSNFVFYLGNHDHIFVDSNNEHLVKLLEVAETNYGQYSTLVMSHWPENIRWAKSGYIGLDQSIPTKLNKNYRIDENNLYYQDISIDSLNILNREILKDWILTGNWGLRSVPRMDGIGKDSILTIRQAIGIPLPEQEIIIPFKEQLRHFDGYMHQRISNNVCPALSIPDGFFTKQIKIRFGYDDYKDGWVNINPIKENYRAYNTNGVDDKILLEDIPLFWKDKIIEIDKNPAIDEEIMIQHRLVSILNMVYSDSRYNPYIDKEVEIKVLNEYIKNYKQYKLI